MATCPKCGWGFPPDDDRLESILAEKDKEIAALKKRIEELEAAAEAQRRLGEWSKNQLLRRVKKKKADNDKGF